MEAAVSELHLDSTPTTRATRQPESVGEVVEQRALADAGLAAEDEDPASTGEGVRQEALERVAFRLTSDERAPPASPPADVIGRPCPIDGLSGSGTRRPGS